MVETKAFARLVQQRVIYTKLDQEHIDIEFDNFEISIFPLRTTVVKARLALPKQKIHASFDTLSFTIDFFDLFENRLIINELKTTGGSFDIPSENSTKRSKDTFIVNKGLDDIHGIIEELPFEVRRFSFNNAFLTSGYLDGYVKKIDITYRMNQKRIDILAECTNVTLEEHYGLNREIDSIQFQARTNEQDIIFESLAVGLQEGQLVSKGRFIVKDNTYEGTVEGRMPLEDLKQYVLDNHSFIIPVSEGMLQFDGTVNVQKSLNFKGGVTALDVESQYGNFEKMDAQINLAQNFIGLNRLLLTTASGTMAVRDEIRLKLDEGWPLQDAITIRLNNMRTGELFAFLGDRLRPFDSLLTGNVEFSFDKNNDSLVFVLEDDFKLARPRLVFNDLQVLSFEKLTLRETTFSHNLKKNLFSVQSHLYMGESKLDVKGFVGSDAVDIGFQKGNVDFDLINNIAGIKTKGKAEMDFTVAGPIDDVKIHAVGRGTGLAIDKYFFGESDFSGLYHINSQQLQVSNIETLSVNASMKGQGVFDFLADTMDIKIDIQKMSYAALQKFIGFHLPGFMRGIEGLNFVSSGNTSLKIHFGKGIDRIDIDLHLSSISYLNELIADSRVELTIDNKKIYLENVNVKKDFGRITGALTYDYSQKLIDYSFRMEEIDTDSFFFYRSMNMGPTGKISGFFKGKGPLDKFSLDANFVLNDARIGNQRIGEPSLRASGNSRAFSVSWQLLDGRINGRTYLNLANKEPSNLKVRY